MRLKMKKIKKMIFAMCFALSSIFIPDQEVIASNWLEDSASIVILAGCGIVVLDKLIRIIWTHCCCCIRNTETDNITIADNTDSNSGENINQKSKK